MVLINNQISHFISWSLVNLTNWQVNQLKKLTFGISGYIIDFFLKKNPWPFGGG